MSEEAKPVSVLNQKLDQKYSSNDFVESYLSITVNKSGFKYPSLQSRHVISGKLDEDVANWLVKFLLKTNWKPSNAINFITRQYSFFDETGLLGILGAIGANNILDDPNHAKDVIEELKKICKVYVQYTRESTMTIRNRQ
jgi:hypothetical protein